MTQLGQPTMTPEEIAEWAVQVEAGTLFPSPEPPHGTIARYTSHRFPCRCGECRLAMRDYMREYRRIRRLLQGVDR